MKKTVRQLIAILLVLSFTAAMLIGCTEIEDPAADSSENSSDKTSSVTVQSETESPEKTSSAEGTVTESDWTILGTYWQNGETGEIIILNKDFTAVWSNEVGGEAQYGRFEWNVDNNRGRLYIDDWDVMMEITGRGLRLFNQKRDDTVDQLDKLPDGYRLNNKPVPSEPDNKTELKKDALTDTYWLFVTAYYAFLPGGVVKVGNDTSGELSTGKYTIDENGKGVITINREDTSFRYTDGKLEINTEWGYHKASTATKTEFETVFS